VHESQRWGPRRRAPFLAPLYTPKRSQQPRKPHYFNITDSLLMHETLAGPGCGVAEGCQASSGGGDRPCPLCDPRQRLRRRLGL
jgi:hypothetical protein